MTTYNTQTPETNVLFEKLRKEIKPIFRIAKKNLKKKKRPIKLEKVIGSGGFSIVAKGHISRHILDGRERKNLPCAVKIVYPEIIHGENKDTNYDNRQRFKKEVESSDRVYTNLKNLGEGLEKHIVRPYDDGEFDYDKDESLGIKRNWFVKKLTKILGLNPEIDWRYMVSEYVEGNDLSEYMEQISTKEIIEVGKIICDVLEVTHDQGFYHRDIKPSNILIPNGKIQNLKLGDFGLAKRIASGKPIYGSILGSMGFAAPEQIDYKSRFLVDGRADIFGLGAVLYSLAGNCLPYGEEDVKLLHGRDHIPIPKPKQLKYIIDEPEFSDVVMKALSPNRRYRYSTMGEFYKALDWVYNKVD